MSKDLQTNNGVHINPYENAAKTHVPAAGDVYATKSPSFNGREIVRLVKRCGEHSWETVNAFTGEPYRNLSDDTLKQYYRWIQTEFTEISSLATSIVSGKASEAALLITGAQEAPQADSESLMATESPEHIEALLESSERIKNKMEEAQLVAKCMIEERKAQLDAMLHDMNGYLAKVNEKVANLVKIITVLNLYTGATVDIHHIAEGDPAPKGEPLSMRQRILFMDEELCIHIDHEADYQDVNLFFDWLKDPANRDIIVPEPRCVVCLKPKRFPMNYRSGDAHYDAQRNIWNRHTYVVIRNGDNLWWFESEDLEVYEWAFPHDDFEESFAKRLQEETHSAFKDNILNQRKNVTYRDTKYMMFLQGLIDQRQDLIGPTAKRLNLMKLQGIRLIRDDENLIGTGRKPWKEFRDEKNTLIRRGTRILYVAGPCWSDSYKRRPTPCSGQFVRYYSNEWSMPSFPGTGLYSADEIEVVHHYDHGQPVMIKHPRLVFKYLPGDEVFDRTEYEYRQRKQRVSWEFDPCYVLNYDAVSIEELQGYLEDRTLRTEFASMIPILVEMRRHKVAEQKDEEAFKTLLSDTILRESDMSVTGKAMDEAIAWWKEKVIFTRALRCDDEKAWKMIKARLMKQLKENPQN